MPGHAKSLSYGLLLCQLLGVGSLLSLFGRHRRRLRGEAACLHGDVGREGGHGRSTKERRDGRMVAHKRRHERRYLGGRTAGRARPHHLLRHVEDRRLDGVSLRERRAAGLFHLHDGSGTRISRQFCTPLLGLLCEDRILQRARQWVAASGVDAIEALALLVAAHARLKALTVALRAARLLAITAAHVQLVAIEAVRGARSDGARREGVALLLQHLRNRQRARCTPLLGGVVSSAQVPPPAKQTQYRFRQPERSHRQRVGLPFSCARARAGSLRLFDRRRLGSRSSTSSKSVALISSPSSGSVSSVSELDGGDVLAYCSCVCIGSCGVFSSRLASWKSGETLLAGVSPCVDRAWGARSLRAAAAAADEGEGAAAVLRAAVLPCRRRGAPPPYCRVGSAERWCLALRRRLDFPRLLLSRGILSRLGAEHALARAAVGPGWSNATESATLCRR
eukprot:scaffold60743_cov63-Phaeocystis_antarctica.AAC.2